MAFKRKIKDFIKLEEIRKAQIAEDVKDRRRQEKIKKLVPVIPAEIAEKNKGKFLKWLRLFKQGYGKKGMQWLLRQSTINVKFGKEFVNRFNETEYLFDCQMLKFLEDLKIKRTKNKEAMHILDNILEFGHDQLDSFIILATAEFRRNINIPKYANI